MAAAAAEALGVPAEWALAAMAGVGEVAGRFTTRSVAEVAARLMLAKNPAGWGELLELVCRGLRAGGGGDQRPGGRRSRSVLVVGRALRAAGRRAGGGHRGALPRPLGAPPLCRGGAPDGGPRGARRRRRAADGTEGRVEFIGNYTAFFDLLGRRR